MAQGRSGQRRGWVQLYSLELRPVEFDCLRCCSPAPCPAPPPAGRAAQVQKHFESAIGADDFIQRVEMALYAFGFTGENSIGE